MGESGEHFGQRPSAPRPHRPGVYADLTGYIDAAGGVLPGSHAEIASATAAVVVRAGRAGGDERDRFVQLADRVGLETLAELWRDSDPVSLPGALWALYLLRQWCCTAEADVARLWRAGAPLAPAEAVVAGVAEPAGVEDVRGLADAILAGIYGGDLAVALERAAALFRVVAAGRRDIASASTGPADDTEAAKAEFELADRNDRAAADLALAARRWREGALH